MTQIMPPSPDGSGGTTPPATTPGTGSGTTPPDYQALYEQAQRERQEYYNRWTGLQGKYNQEQSKWTSDAEKLRTLETELQAALGQKTTFEAQVKTLQEASGSTVGELNQLKGAHERLTMIMKEFPTLIPFLAVQQGDKTHDLLPQGSGDDLRVKLAAFATSMQAQLGQQIQQKVTPPGATPPAPPAASTPGPADLRKQMAEAIGKGDLTAYNQIYDELLKQTAAK